MVMILPATKPCYQEDADNVFSKLGLYRSINGFGLDTPEARFVVPIWRLLFRKASSSLMTLIHFDNHLRDIFLFVCRWRSCLERKGERERAVRQVILTVLVGPILTPSKTFLGLSDSRVNHANTRRETVNFGSVANSENALLVVGHWGTIEV